MNRFLALEAELIGSKTKGKKRTVPATLTRYSYQRSASPPAPDWCRLIYNAIRIAVEEEGVVWTKPNGVKYNESDPAMLPELQRYWEALYKPATARQMAKDSAADKLAWSAAFISYVMKEAGFTAAQGFPVSERHITYIVEAMRNRENRDKSKPFWLYDISELSTAMPVPGDLLCFNREGSSHSYTGLKKLYFGKTATPSGKSHTDIVVHTRTEGKALYVETVGGNVHGSGLTVGMKYFKIEGGRIYRLDAAGKNLGEETAVFGILKMIECPGNRN